jgi:hypothetical protein
MPRYILTYIAPTAGGQSGPEAMTAWNAFFEDLGESLVDPGNPVFQSTTLGNCGTDIASLAGYSVIGTEDLNAATRLAQNVPILKAGGGVEVGVITNLDDFRTTGRRD